MTNPPSHRIHDPNLDNAYLKVGATSWVHGSRLKPTNARKPCPKCGKYYLRSLWVRKAVLTKNKKLSKTEVVIGKWCQGCHYFESTIPLPGDEK